MSRTAPLQTFLLKSLFAFSLCVSSNAAESPVPVIDVLVVYPAPAQDHNPADLESWSRRQFADANAVLLNSDARARLRLVHIAKVFYSLDVPREDYLLLTLDRLRRRGDGFLDEVHQLRDLHGADVVLLWKSMTGPGLAHAAHSEAEAFGIVTEDRLDLARIVGRIIGCGPEPGAWRPSWEGPPTGIFPDSAANILNEPGLHGTVMSSLAPVGVFSNPRISYFGRPLGELGRTDNVRTIDLRAPLIAGFRGSAGQSTPPEFSWRSPSFGGRLTPGQDVVLEVEAANPEQVQSVEFVTDHFYNWDPAPRTHVVTTAPFRLTLTNVAPARYRWAARVTDRAGDVSQSAVEFYVAAAFDAFAQGLPLNTPEDSRKIDLAGLTREEGEPAPADPEHTTSAWFSWVAPEDGLISGEWVQEGWPLPVSIGIFRGNSVSALTPVTGAVSTNNYFAAPVQRGEQISLSINAAPAVPGTGLPGTLGVRFVRPLTNTSFASRALVEGLVVTLSSHTVDLGSFTNEVGPRAATVWWKWVAPASGVVRFSKPAWVRTHWLNASRGSDLASLEQIGGLGPDFTESTMIVSAGDEIQLSAGSIWTGGPGPFEFTFELHPVAANHVSENRIQLTDHSRNFSVPFTIPGPKTDSSPPDLQSFVAWWEWTAPADGRVAILAGFQGLRVDVFIGEETLTPVPPAGAQLSPGRFPFDVQSGVKYQIAMSWPDLENFSWNCFGKSWRLAYIGENDAFDQALPLSGTKLEWQIPNSIGTREPGEKFVAEGSLWFRWTAPASGIVTLHSDPLSTTFGAALSGAVFRGTTVSNLVAEMPLDYLPARPQFLAQAGTEYRLMIAGGLTQIAYLPAIIRLELSAPPAHDAYEERVRIGRAEEYLGGLFGATRAPSDPRLSGVSTNLGTLWWSWTAPSDGWLHMGASQGALGVCRQTPAGLQLIASVTSNSKIGVRQGERLELMLAGRQNSSAWLALEALQPNDSFANRTPLVIARDSQEVTSYTFGATREAGEDLSGTNLAGRSRWWTFQVAVPTVAEVQFGPAGSNLYFEQFRWDGSGEMDTIAWGYGTNSFARISFHAVPGVEYPFVVDAVGSWEGEYTVSVRLYPEGLAPANDNFANAAQMSAAVDIRGVSLRGASAESGEPGHAGQPAARSLWWRWTASSSGPVKIDVRTPAGRDSGIGLNYEASAAHRPRLSVYQGDLLQALTLVAHGAAHPTNSLQTECSFNATEGESFLIALDTGNADSSSLDVFTLLLAQALPNDLFQNREVISGDSPRLTGWIYGAARGAGEWVPPLIWGGPDTNAGNVWFEWTPQENATVAVRTSSRSTFFTWAVWPSGRALSFPPVAYGASGGGYFSVQAGQTYYIAVYGQPDLTTGFSIEMEGLRRPANDDFTNRATLSGERVRVEERIELASRETDEPPHAQKVLFSPSGNLDAPSLWWTWTAPRSGSFLLASSAANRGPMEEVRAEIFVYRGDSIASLARVAESSGQQTEYNYVILTAEAGITYQIALCPLLSPQNFSSEKQYSSQLSIDPLSPNHSIQNAIELSGSEVNFSGDLRSSYFGMWWRWTAPRDGRVALQLQVQSRPLDKVSLEIAQSLNGEVLMNFYYGVADEFGRISAGFEVVSGRSYYFRVAPRSLHEIVTSAVHTFSAALSFEPIAVSNDQYVARTVVQPGTVLLTADLRTASVEPGEPLHRGHRATRSLWWEWSAPTSGRWSIVSSSMRWGGLLVALYRGESLETLVPINPIYTADRNALFFRAQAGEKIKIALAYVGTAEFPFSALICETKSPPNDNLGDAQSLASDASAWIVSTFGATTEAGEPLPPDEDPEETASTWYNWIAPSSASINVNVGVNGPSVWWGPPAVTIFKGNSIATLLPIGESRVGPNLASNFWFDSLAGERYYIRVRTRVGDAASFGLSLSEGVRPDNDDFAARWQLYGTRASLNFKIADASLEPGEPNALAPVFERSLWWSWTAPANGWTTLDTTGTPFDTRLAVYTGNALGSLSIVAANDDEFSPPGIISFATSRLGFQAQQGTEYHIQVSSHGRPVDIDGAPLVGKLTLIGESLPAPSIAELEFSATYPRITLRGAAGQTVWIQSSDNLIDWTWSEIIRMEGAEVVWLDQRSSATAPHLFYRLVFASP